MVLARPANGTCVVVDLTSGNVDLLCWRRGVPVVDISSNNPDRSRRAVVDITLDEKNEGKEKGKNEHQEAKGSLGQRATHIGVAAAG